MQKKTKVPNKAKKPVKAVAKAQVPKIKFIEKEHELKWIQSDADGTIIMEFDGNRFNMTKGDTFKVK